MKKVMAAVDFNDPKWRFAERVARLVAKGNTKKEAEESVRNVILTKEHELEELEPVPAKKGATVPLIELVNGQRFFVPGGLVGDFLLEGWTLLPGQFEKSEKGADDLRKAPVVRQITQRRTASKAEVLLKPATVSAWTEQTRVTVIEDFAKEVESEGKKEVAKSLKTRYNQNQPGSGEGDSQMKNGKAAKKAAKSADGFRAHNVVLVHKRSPKEGEVPDQAMKVMEILKSLGKASPDELVAKMKGKIESKQPMRAVLNLHRSKLVKAGFIAIQV